MIIVKANLNDLDNVMDIVEQTRAYFKDAGIPQWQGEYPNRIDIEEDIKLQRLYVLKEDNLDIGMFALVYPDHNYDYIEDGKWLDNSEYIAVHRLAIKSEYKNRGFASKAFDYVKENYDHIRVDTHALNEVMKHTLIKNEFKYCGIVYMEDGTKRNAYEWSRKKPDYVTDFSNNYGIKQEATY